MQYYYTRDKNDCYIATPVRVNSVQEAREWFIAVGIHMVIDPQPAPDVDFGPTVYSGEFPCTE